MNLIEQSYKEKQERPKKVMRVIFIVMLVFLITIFVIVGILISIRPKPEIAKIDGVENNEFLKNIIKINEEEYIPIADLANLIGYSYNRGEYNNLSESTTECYVERKDASQSIEAVNLKLESNQIYKIDLTVSESDYEPIQMNYPVKSNNGRLCISLKDIVNVFNTTYKKDDNENVRYLSTLPYLVRYYTNIAMDKRI